VTATGGNPTSLEPDKSLPARARQAFAQRSDTLALKQRVVAALLGPWRLVPLLTSLAVVWAFFTAENSLFLSSRNLTNLSNQIAVSTLLALGLVFVMVVRQLDISLAASSAVAGAIAAALNVESHWSVELAIAVALAMGVAAAVVQCAIATHFRAPSFIVTLGGMFILEAGLLWLLPSAQVIPLYGSPLQDIAGNYLPRWLSYVLAAAGVCLFARLRWTMHVARVREGTPSDFTRSTLLPTAGLAAFALVLLVFVFNAYLGVPIPAVIVITTTAILAYIGAQTPFGKHVYAVGGNPEAARRAGIRVGLVTTATFAIAGLLAATAGIVNASRNLGVSAESSDLTLLLGALAAVVIGGVSLFGGRGNVWGAVIGGILIGSLQNGLGLMNASTQAQWTVEGVVLIVAVVVDSSIAKRLPSLE
jgi:D-xylose transport system permease protein